VSRAKRLIERYVENGGKEEVIEWKGGEWTGLKKRLSAST
jgi:hypothetical protein